MAVEGVDIVLTKKEKFSTLAACIWTQDNIKDSS